MATYSLGARCGSEFIACVLVIYLGLSVIANDLLSKTKGHGIGFGWVAMGFGLSFGVVIMMFGYISAVLNPATALALWVSGQLPFTQFLALVACELAGMFLGAVLVWAHHICHFRTVPEPAPTEPAELLLRSRDHLGRHELDFASYNTRPEDTRHSQGVRASLHRVVDDARYFLGSDAPLPEEVLERALGKDGLAGGGAGGPALRRRSVQVADMHRRLQDISLRELEGSIKAVAAATVAAQRAAAGQGSDGGGHAAETKAAAPPAEPHATLNGRPEAAGGAHTGHGKPLAAALHQLEHAYSEHMARHQDRASRLLDAAIRADQNAKLSVFCTRPAIYAPAFNWLVEFLCALLLVFGSLQLLARGDQLYEPWRGLFASFQGMWVGFYVFVCVIALGGPTGIAANPARDLAPRLAHWLLPIPGKGPSEWYYSWIPLTACLAGGAAAGGFYKAVQLMSESGVPAVLLPELACACGS